MKEEVRRKSFGRTVKIDNQGKGGKEIFYAERYIGYELSFVASYDTEYFKRVLKMSGLYNKTKDLIKKALAKT